MERSAEGFNHCCIHVGAKAHVQKQTNLIQPGLRALLLNANLQLCGCPENLA